jgi:hypothetical protein
MLIKNFFRFVALTMSVWLVASTPVMAASTRVSVPELTEQDVLYYNPCGTGGSTAQAPNSSTVPKTSGGGGGCGSDDMQANKDQIWAFLKSKGLNDDAAAGIMGNMEKESSFNPKATNPGGCRGIVQWCGGRNTSMEAEANAQGKSWDCLGFQLEYMWYEMTETEQGQMTSPDNSRNPGHKLEIPLADALNGNDFSKRSVYQDMTGPGAAALIFHDYFERANTNTGEDKGRAEAADGQFQAYTGQSPDASALGNSSSGSGKAGDNCGASSPQKGQSAAIPSAECAELIPKFNELVDSGKIILTDPSRQENDFKNCTTDPISCHAGVNPNTVRATVALAENSSYPVTLWSFNTGHDCNGGEHPIGKGVDVVCDTNTEKEKCDEQYKYLYDHAEELGIGKMILDPPPNGYQCMYDGKPIACSPTYDGAGNHSDHIHISMK